MSKPLKFTNTKRKPAVHTDDPVYDRDVCNGCGQSATKGYDVGIQHYKGVYNRRIVKLRVCDECYEIGINRDMRNSFTQAKSGIKITKSEKQ